LKPEPRQLGNYLPFFGPLRGDYFHLFPNPHFKIPVIAEFF